MPIVSVPFTGAANKNVDQITLSQHSVDIIDGYLDEGGYVNRRHGMTEISFPGVESQVDGLFWWDEKGYFIAVISGNVYTVTTVGVATSIGSGMVIGTRVSFATAKIAGADVLAMANGSQIRTTDGVTVSVITDADAPGQSTFIVFLDKYLISNDTSSSENGKVKYSDVNDPNTWNALNFFDAERKPDAISGLGVVGDQLVTFGYRSIEFFYNDGVTPFRRFEGGGTNVGTPAPYTIQHAESLFWLFMDENRRVNKMVGREITPVSFPFEKELNTVTTIANASADIINVEGRSFYVLNFPDAEKSYAYDYRLDKWYRWGFWDTTISDYTRYKGHYAAYNTRSGKQWIGDKSNGKIYILSGSVYQDDGNEIRTLIRTGFIDHGTGMRKRSNKLMLRMKRGIAKNGSDEAGTVTIKYRDGTEGAFGNERWISTGVGGDSKFHTELRRNGQYRQRQWEMVCSDNVPFVVGGFEEDVTLSVS